MKITHKNFPNIIQMVINETKNAKREKGSKEP